MDRLGFILPYKGGFILFEMFQGTLAEVILGSHVDPDEDANGETFLLGHHGEMGTVVGSFTHLVSVGPT